MQRLSIPLHRYQQTTRLSRRVVSLSIIAMTIGIFLLFLGGIIWYGRDTVSSSAPQGTVLVLHFLPNRSSWDDVDNALRHIPLVSNRSLTIEDIRPFTYGEFSIFIGSDGSRSVAIRARESDVYVSRLDALGILVTTPAQGIVFLSDKPVARMNWLPPRIWLGFLHFPWNTHIGSVYAIGDADISGSLYASEDGAQMRFPKHHVAKSPWKAVPTNTVAVLSTPALPNASIREVTSEIDTILASYATPLAATISSNILTAPGAILLTSNGAKLNYLIKTTATAISLDDQRKAIQMAAALQLPRIQPFRLPDDSLADEIIVDPSLSTIEEITQAGSVVSRVSANDGSYVYSVQREDDVFITNDQSLLDFGLGAQRTENSPKCFGDVAFVDLRSLFGISGNSVNARDSNTFSILADSYSSIGVDEGLLTTTIRLCQ